MLTENSSKARKSDLPSLTAADYGLNKPVYSIVETMMLADMGRTRLYDLINRGEIPLLKIGRRSLIATPDLVRFLNKSRVSATASAA